MLHLDTAPDLYDAASGLAQGEEEAPPPPPAEPTPEELQAQAEREAIRAMELRVQVRRRTHTSSGCLLCKSCGVWAMPRPCAPSPLLRVAVGRVGLCRACLVG